MRVCDVTFWREGRVIIKKIIKIFNAKSACVCVYTTAVLCTLWLQAQTSMWTELPYLCRCHRSLRRVVRVCVSLLLSLIAVGGSVFIYLCAESHVGLISCPAVQSHRRYVSQWCDAFGACDVRNDFLTTCSSSAQQAWRNRLPECLHPIWCPRACAPVSMCTLLQKKK